MAFNIVELAASIDGDDDSAFDQPCKFGHRVDGHAVYCHADHWKDSPRKCRRTWYTGGETKDEDCPGFQPNPDFTKELNPTPIENPCSECAGKRHIDAAEEITTCQHCMGDGNEPKPIQFTDDEQRVLESSWFDDDWYGFIAETEQQCDAVQSLDEADCIQLKSVSWTSAGVSVYLIRRTAKGKHLLRVFWDSPYHKAELRKAERRRKAFVKQQKAKPNSGHKP